MNRVIFVLVAIILLASCGESTEFSDGTKIDSATSQKKVDEMTYYSGQNDLPKNEYQITSSGLGKIIVGDSIEKIIALVQPLASKIVDEEYHRDGKVWPAKMVKLANGKHIFLAMVNTINLVSEISTNDSSYVTKSGLRVGMVLDPAVIPFDSIVSNAEQRSFTIGSDGVWFRVNKALENKYFKSDKPSINILKDAKVEELFIVCGDC